MVKGRVGAALLTTVFFLGACDIPRDVEGTLDRVRGGVMRAGIAPSDPWTVLGDTPSGVEVSILQDFAEDLDARIEWVEGSEEELLSALEFGELDVVIGGLTIENPWASLVTFTHPYLTTPAVIGTPRGEPIPKDIAGVEVAVEKGSHLTGLVEKTDAVAIEVEDLSQVDGAAAVDNWLLDDLELRDTGIRLEESDHVMAVRHGENAWLVALERFLLTHESDIAKLLEEQGEL